MITIQTNKTNLITALNKVTKIITSIGRMDTEKFGITLSFKGDKLHIIGLSESRYVKIALELISYASDVEVSAVSYSTDFKKLLEVLQTLSEENISLEFSESSIVLRAKKTRITLPLSLKELVEPSIEKKSMVEIRVQDMQFALKNLLFSVSSDTARPILSSIKFIPLEQGGTLCVSTDGFRLSLVALPITLPTEMGSLQIPAAFLRDCMTQVLLPSQKTVCAVTLEDMCGFEQAGISVFSKIIVGEYPPYERVVFSQHAMSVSFSTSEMYDAIKTISILSRDYSNIIIFDVFESRLVVRPKKEVGGENESVVENVKVTGLVEEKITFAFNAKYILDFLSTITDDTATMRMNKSDSPTLFVPGSPETTVASDSFTFRHIIMPVRISE